MWIPNSLKVVHEGAFDIKSSLVNEMPWHQIGDMPLSDLMMTQITDVYDSPSHIVL